MSANPLTELVAEFGEYEASNGIRILLQGDIMMFLASHQGNDLEVHVDIIQILEAIQRHNAKIGS